MAPAWFQDRQVETGLLARYVTDRGSRWSPWPGRGGIGKTAMVCRLLKGLEAGRIPDVEGDSAAITVGGIVYLSRNGVHKVEYPTLVADLLRLLPADEAQRLQRLYQDPHHTPAEMMLALLEAFPAGEPVVVLLDNLESVMDTERETLTEPGAARGADRGADRARARGHGDRHHPGDADRAAEGRAGRGSASCGWTRAWAPRTPRPSCGSSTTTATWGCATPPMSCWTGCASTPAGSRGRWRRSRRSWTAIAP